MRYVSTRGEAPDLGFADTLLTGLAADGGLYLPEAWPEIAPETIRSFAGRPYAEIAHAVLAPFVGDDIREADLARMVDEAYGTFPHPAVAPLVQIGPSHFVLELFHGPTMAFKDVAMQLIARLMDHALAERDQRATIVGATSGDTGGAAIAAFAASERADVFILYPHGRVSPVQRRQMTTSGAANVHALAMDGNFDDCQAMVKAMFADRDFREGVGLSAVNSINWGRIMAQIVYYFTAAASLGAPDRRVSFTVPTGNFGDIFAGYAAKRMGLPVDRLVVATNENDVLARTLATGHCDKADVRATMSPSMDIQVSSNFERLVFEASGRDPATVRGLMDSLRQSGGFTLPEAVRAAIAAEFDADTTDEAATARTIADTLERTAYLLDPHTAVGVGVAEGRASAGTGPMITLGTAHPAKFPEAIEAATGRSVALPPAHAGLMDRPEHAQRLTGGVEDVMAFIRSRTRASREGAAA